MPDSKSVTWLDFISDCRNQDIDPELLSFDDLESILGRVKNIQPFKQYSVPCSYLLDYSTGRYTYFSENVYTILGFKKEDFEKGGIEFMVALTHEDDLRLFNDHIFPDRLKFLQKINPAEHPNYIFSINYRLKNGQGKYIKVMQRNLYLRSDPNGAPLLCLGMIQSMEEDKIPDYQLEVIEKISAPSSGSGAEVVSQKSYPG